MHSLHHVVSLLFFVLPEANSKSDEYHKYCIVGAGPAGVQIGHYMLESGRDFILLERTPRAAAWFSMYPIPRMLNSINRRYTRRGFDESPEFNLRHDWNSLLGSEKTVGLFGNWSDEYLPTADSIVEYINAFAQPQAEAGHLQFNQDVQEIAKCKQELYNGEKDKPCRYTITVKSTSEPKDTNCTLDNMGSYTDVSQTAKCASMGKRQVLNMDGLKVLVKKVSDLEATIQDAARRGSVDVDAMKELIISKEALKREAISGGSTGAASEQPQTKPVVKTRTISCGVLVMTNGMHRPRQVKDWFDGLEKVKTDYADLQTIPRSDFQNRSVMIFGFGNAALEMADHLRSVSKDIFLIHRSQAKWMKNSRYVGDLRLRTGTTEEAAKMGSNEGNMAIQPEQAALLVMVHCGPDENNLGFQGKAPICFFSKDPQNPDNVILTPVDEARAGLVKEAQQIFGAKVFMQGAPGHVKDAAKLAKNLHLKFKVNVTKVLCMKVAVLMQKMNAKQMKLLVQLRDHSHELHLDGQEFRKPYDVAISALGWQYDQRPFKFQIDMVGPGKNMKGQAYPKLNFEYESTNNQHLFVAGAAAHGLDRYSYKASGGFIHGFRFVCRALYRVLEERYEAEDHPRSQPIAFAAGNNGWQEFPWQFDKVKTSVPKNDHKLMTGIRKSLSPLWDKLLTRIDDAGGPYEMVGGSLVDSIIFDCNNSKAFYLEDLQEDMIHDRYSSHPRLTWSYYYGLKHVHKYHDMCGIRNAAGGIFSSFVHPVVQYFPPGLKGGKDGKTFSQTHQHLWHVAKDSEVTSKFSADHPHSVREDHPSAFWAEIPGVTRMHIGETWIFHEWSDVEGIKQIQLFMTHVEHAAAQFCTKSGPGIVKRPFDEAFDVQLKTNVFTNKIQAGFDKTCWGNKTSETRGGAY